MANCLLRCGHGFSSSSLISTGGKFGASACWWSAACCPHYHLPPYLSLVTRHRTGALHDSIIYSMQHPPLHCELWCAIPALNYVFFFYSVTDVISNVAKCNTSVKIYLSKSKITDFKNYLKITKYTKKLLNYSNVSKSNSLL